jgi:ubiquitin carboxyl-terminal hydrolase 5/13
MSFCIHIEKANRIPSSSSVIYKEECMLCFDSQDGSAGLDVCLTCYQGYCPGQGHNQLHFQKSNHSIFLNIKRKIEKVKA